MEPDRLVPGSTAGDGRGVAMSKQKDSYLGGALRAVEWLVVAVVLAAALAAVVVPRLAGATPYAVMTGSMRPHMPPGALVVVRPVSMDDVEVGSVITYQPQPGDPSVITHRVVATGIDTRGREIVWTQGDANDVRDPVAVHHRQIRGEVWYVVPYLGHLTSFLDAQAREVGVLVLAAALLLYAAVMIGGALVDRLHRPGTHGPRHA